MLKSLRTKLHSALRNKVEFNFSFFLFIKFHFVTVFTDSIFTFCDDFFKLDKSIFVEIEIGRRIIVKDPEGDFKVTAYDANHCPGIDIPHYILIFFYYYFFFSICFIPFFCCNFRGSDVLV